MRKRVLTFCCLLATVIITSAGPSAAQMSFVDWTTIFNTDGSVKNLGDGFEAVFLEDIISAGVAIDMSALDVVNGVVFNGPVESAHDLGNGFVLAARDEFGNLILSAAAERLTTEASTYVEFEFNQAVVNVTSGSPWPIHGERNIHDFKIRFNFVAGDFTSIQYGAWNGEIFDLVTSYAPAQSGCFVASSDTEFCNGSPFEGLPQQNEAWDSSYNIVQVPDADGFVEARVNLGPNSEFTSITLRTPSDISMGSFQAMGYWAALKNTLAAQ